MTFRNCVIQCSQITEIINEFENLYGFKPPSPDDIKNRGNVDIFDGSVQVDEVFIFICYIARLYWLPLIEYEGVKTLPNYNEYLRNAGERLLSRKRPF